MKKLPKLLQSWGTPQFRQELLEELQQLEPCQLPLKQVARFSGLFEQDGLQFSLLSNNEDEQLLILKLSVFYQEISSMCPCSGQEIEKIDGHCEMNMTINRQDGTVEFSIL